MGDENISHPQVASSSSVRLNRDGLRGRSPKRNSSDAGIDADEGRPTEDEDTEGIRQALEEPAKQDVEMGISFVDKVEAEVCKWINEVKEAMGKDEAYEVVLKKMKTGVGTMYMVDIFH